MRVFTLKFIRKILSVDLLHFLLDKKGYIFKRGQLVGIFMINMGKAFRMVEAMLEAMNLRKEKYDIMILEVSSLGEVKILNAQIMCMILSLRLNAKLTFIPRLLIQAWRSSPQST